MSQLSYIKRANRLGTAAGSTASALAADDEKEKNVNGVVGGIGYAAEKIGLGFLSSLEGLVDYTAGGIAKLLKNSDFAEEVFKNDWVNYNHADEWYNPSDGWKFVGDVTGGIGTSLPAIVTSAGIVAASGGAAAPALVSGASSLVAGLGAAGNATKEAYYESGKLDGKAFGYGALSGATEAGLEYVSGALGAGSSAIARRFSEGTAKNLAKSTAAGVGKSVAKKASHSFAKQAIGDFMSEAFEEGMSEILAPVYKRMTYDPNAESATAGEVGYAALVGGLSGVLMGAGANALGSAANIASGAASVKNGSADSVIRISREISSDPDYSDTGYGLHEQIREHYAELEKSLEKTDGQVATLRQKLLVGTLKRENAAAVMLPFIERSAENVVRSPELYAERFKSYEARDMEGAPLRFTAEELLRGIDMSDMSTQAGRRRYLKSLRKSLTSDTALSRVAIAEATGTLVMDTRKMASSALSGERLASGADFTYLAENGSREEIEALSRLFGTDDFGKLTRSELNAKIGALFESGALTEKAAQIRRMLLAEGGDNAARPAPSRFSSSMENGVYRVDELFIIKEGGLFYLYDRADRSISRALSAEKLNAALSEYRTRRAEGGTVNTAAETPSTAEKVKAAESTVNGTEAAPRGTYERLKAQNAEAARVAATVDGYSKLSAPNKREVRALIRSARAHGLADGDVRAIATVSARAGVKITLDESACLRRRGGKAFYVDGFYDGESGTITVNPRSARSTEALLCHELLHAIAAELGGTPTGARTYRRLVARAAEALGADECRRIAARYGEVGVVEPAAVFEEIAAHYGETIASPKLFRALFEERPSLGARVVSFFKGSASDYAAVSQLGGTARAFYKYFSYLARSLARINENSIAYFEPRLAGEVRAESAAAESRTLEWLSRQGSESAELVRAIEADEAITDGSLETQKKPATNTKNDSVRVTGDNDEKTPATTNTYARYALPEALKKLGEYDATRVRHIESSGKDRVVRDYDEIIEFIKRAKTNPPFERLHIGIISDNTATLVKANTGEDIKGYDFVLASNFVFHIYDSHGNEVTEAQRGQKAVDDANIENIIEAVIDPDDVSLVSDSTGTALRFEKLLEGRNVAITITSTKKSTLTLKSAWIINKKSGGRTPSANANALAGTPEANSRSSTDNSIIETAKKINHADEKNSTSNEKSSASRTALNNKEKALAKTNADAGTHTRFALVTDEDLTEYMAIGKTLHTRHKKQRMLENGKKPILTSESEIKDFISNAIQGKAGGEVRAFARVPKRLAEAISDVRSTLELEGDYLEFQADALREAYKVHSSPKMQGDIALSESDFENLHHHIFDFDGVLSVNDYNGKTEVHIYRRAENGYYQIITVSSSERKSLQITKLIGVSKEKFEKKYAKKIERNTGSPRMPEASNPSTKARHTAGALSTVIIPETEGKINPSDEKNSTFDEKASTSRTALDNKEKALAKTNADADTHTRYAIKYPDFNEADISSNMEAIADMEAVAAIDASKLEKTGKSPLDTFNEYFASLGNNIASETFGDIALPKSSAKSEIRHGITAEKIASIEAIPAVIERGKVIFSKAKEGGVERIVVCAPIKIGNADYYMGVMLQRDARYQRLYLNNVAIEREASSSSKDNLVTTGALANEDRLSITSIIQKAINVKLEKQINAKNIERNTGSPRMLEASNPSTKARHTAGALSESIISKTAEKIKPSDEKASTSRTASNNKEKTLAKTNAEVSGETVQNKNREDPAHFILRLKSLKKAVPTYDPARSSKSSITESTEKVNPSDKKNFRFGDDSVRYAIKYPSFSEEELAHGAEKLADMKPVALISESRLEKTGKSPRTMFEEYFAKLGNSIYSEVFGDIVLGKASAKSEIRHGVTAVKLAALEAIPAVIESGEVIFFGKKAGAEESIVVCAPIKIGSRAYYMGVMLSRDTDSQYLYLHNVVLEEEPFTVPAHLLTTGAYKKDGDRLFITSILQNALAVKKKKVEIQAPREKSPAMNEMKRKAERFANKDRAERAAFDMPASRSLSPIKLGMSESERYELLKGRSVAVTAVADVARLTAAVSGGGIDNSAFQQTPYGNRAKAFKKLGDGLQVYKEYRNPDSGLTFSFSKTNMKESVSKHLFGYYDFAKLLSCLDSVIDNAVEIEVHNRNKEGYKPDPSLIAVHVLVGAFSDGEYIVPVKLEIKELICSQNSLQVAISLNKIKKSELAKRGSLSVIENKKVNGIVKQGTTENGVAQYPPPFNNIIAQAEEKVNSKVEKNSKSYDEIFDEIVQNAAESDSWRQELSAFDGIGDTRSNSKSGGVALSELFAGLDERDERLRKYVPATFLEKGKNGERYALTESFDEADNVPSAEKSEAPSRKRGLKGRAAAAYLATQIEFVNSQAGIEHAGRRLGVKNVEAFVQAARASKNQAQEMLAGRQWTIMSERVVKSGDGFYRIIAPVMKKGGDYYAKFQSYLFHSHNVDRMSLSARSVERNEANKARLRDIQARRQAIRAELSVAEGKEVGARNAAADRVKALRAEERALRRAARELKERIAAFAPEENKPVLAKRGKNGERVAVTAEESREAVRQYAELYPEFAEYAESVYTYLDNLQKLRLDAGLITEALYAELKEKYPHYVPTYRESVTPRAGAVRGAGNLAVNKTVSRASGGLGQLLSLEKSVSVMTESVIAAGNINRLIAKLYDAADGAKNSDFLVELSRRRLSSDDVAPEREKTVKKNQISFYRGGEEITLSVTPELYAGFRAFNAPSEFSSLPLRFLSASTGLFKKLVTSYNPFFLITNAVRDVMDAGINTKYSAAFPKNYVRAVYHLANNTEVAQLYRAVGGFNSSVFNYERGIVARQSKMGFAVPAGKLAPVLAKMENLNSFIEQLPRFAEFLSSVEAGNSAAQALLDAAEVTTNFGRSGKITRTLNKTVIPFLNPAVQGLSKIIRNTREAFSSVKAFASFSLKLALLGILPQLVNQLFYEGDDDYEDLDDRTKENYFLFKVDDIFIRIPKGRVNSVVAGLVNRGARTAKGESVDWSDYVGNVISQITPVENFARPIWAPISDAINNVTWYGGKIESSRFEAVRPSERYDEATSSIAIRLGKLLNYSPKKLHYIIDQYSGIIGDIVLPLTTARAEKNPFLSRFTTDPVTSNRLSDDFYALYEEAQYSKAAGEGDAQYRLKYLSELRAAASELYKQKRELQASELSDVDKLQQTRAVQALINELYKNAIVGYSEIESAIEKTQGMYDDESEARRRYAEIVRLSFGAEKALQAYSSSAYELTSLLNRAGISFELLYSYYFAARDIKSEATESVGYKSVGKRERLVALVNSMPLTAEQKLLLIAMQGYSLKDGDVGGMSAERAKSRLASYISRRGTLSAAERAKLRKSCGLSAA